MCRPLKDIVAELEEKYPKPLIEDLRDRNRCISDFDDEMEYMFGRFEQYEKEVKFVLEHGMDTKIILRSTMNLTLLMHQFCKSLYYYDYAIDMYLMDTRFEKNNTLLAKFTDVRRKIKILFKNLQENDIIGPERLNKDNVLGKVIDFPKDTDEVITMDAEVLQFHREEIEKMNGAELVVCIEHLLQYFDDKLYELIDKERNIWPDNLVHIYFFNYLVYAKNYWPAEGRNFRPYYEHQRLRGKINTVELENLRLELVRDFEYHPIVGKIWRDNSEDIPRLVQKLREQKIDENQWKYLFSNIFKLEEFDRWIEELRNPPESEEDRQKRARLLRSNKIFNLQPANQKKKIDILLLYQYIDTRFIPEIVNSYEWYALYYVLKKNGILKVRLAEDFAKQMNHEEWFPNVNKKCSAKAIKDYEFLEEAEPGQWVVNIRKKPGTGVSKKSLDTILQRYDYLTDCLDEIFMEEIPIEKGGYTIINYGTYNDIHDNGTVNQK